MAKSMQCAYLCAIFLCKAKRITISRGFILISNLGKIQDSDHC